MKDKLLQATLIICVILAIVLLFLIAVVATAPDVGAYDPTVTPPPNPPTATPPGWVATIAPYPGPGQPTPGVPYPGPEQQTGITKQFIYLPVVSK